LPIKPPRLNYGDTVGIVAPASPPANPKAIDRAVEWLKSLGFEVELGTKVRKRLGFLAGTDRERAGDLMRMFGDRKIHAIVCLRGGYGTARLLPLLDYRVIRANAKILLGYSDITSLHCALLRKANMVSFHGPMLNADLINGELPKFALESLRRTLMEPYPAGSICKDYAEKTVCIIRRGTATGPLSCGNLSVLCTSVGTPYQPSFNGRILCIEDLDEPPFRFDRMLTHLLNAGALQQVAGIAIGLNKNCTDPTAKNTKAYRQTVEDVVKERLVGLKVPIVTGLPFGHVPWNATLPIGVKAKLDANKGDLSIIESAVS